MNDDANALAWEPKLTARLRWATNGGSRKVVIANIAEIMETAADKTRQSLNRLRNYFKSMNTEGIKLYTEDDSIAIAATLGPGDLLHVPPCMMFAEHTASALLA